MGSFSLGVPRPTKPLGVKAYGSIPHLPGSKTGPGDHTVHEGQARIVTERVRDRHDWVYAEEKLDGACVSAAKLGGRIVALSRSGYLADDSPYHIHHLWAAWVETNAERFAAVLEDGERLVGEWLIWAHGTPYRLQHEPFVAFDLFDAENQRISRAKFIGRVSRGRFKRPAIWTGPMSLTKREIYVHNNGPAEGIVFRVERFGRVDFLCKWVRPDHKAGIFMPTLQRPSAIWNDFPEGPESIPTPRTCGCGCYRRAR